MWLDTQDARSRDRNQSNFTLDWVSDLSATKRTTLAKGILNEKYFHTDLDLSEAKYTKRWTTYIDDLFIEMKVCVEPATLFK